MSDDIEDGGLSPGLDGPTIEGVRTLIVAVNELSQTVEDLRTDLGKQSVTLSTATKLMQRARNVSGVAITVAVAAIVVAAVAVGQNIHTNRVLSDERAQRRETLAAQCAQTNDFYARHNKLVGEDENTLRNAFGNAASPAAQQFLKDRIDAYEKTRAIPRDCSTKGIQAYLSTTTTTVSSP